MESIYLPVELNRFILKHPVSLWVVFIPSTSTIATMAMSFHHDLEGATINIYIIYIQTKVEDAYIFYFSHQAFLNKSDWRSSISRLHLRKAITEAVRGVTQVQTASLHSIYDSVFENQTKTLLLPPVCLI